jgi:multiple antibiotic resistance protein
MPNYSVTVVKLLYFYVNKKILSTQARQKSGVWDHKMISDAVRFFISVWIKFFFLLTPFFALSMFLSLTADLEAAARRLIALRVTGSVIVACFVLYFFGNSIFYVFGITLDSFRIGAGSLLFLSAVDLVRKTSSAAPLTQDNNDITVVPLAVPIIVGPATTGALLVNGAKTRIPS